MTNTAKLSVKALRAEARRLKIRNRSLMTTETLRSFVAAAQAWEVHPDNPAAAL